MMAAGLKKSFGFTSVSGGITQQRFPITGDAVQVVHFKLLHLNREVPSSSEVWAEMKRLVLRPATFAETLAFSPLYGEKYPVVALGSSVNINGYDGVIVLYGNSDGKQELDLSWDTIPWNQRFRFLAVDDTAALGGEGT